MNETTNDTIASISTPPGEGGITVIRIAGDKAFNIVSTLVFRDKDKRSGFDFSSLPSHTIHFGYFFCDDTLLDEVVVSLFRSPNSYTGENVVEISSHGSVYIAGRILFALLNRGCRHAEPGEFTKRAFLNGKIDLLQAEAVADLIKAQTEESHKCSIRQLEGSLSEYVHNIRQELIDVTSLIELELDFAEEDIEFVKKEDFKRRMNELIINLEDIISSFIQGKVIRDGVNLVISGKPNSGKSSLFNYLLRANRAIVSSIAGTTRDYIEENIIINGILFRITDTAGIRPSEDEIESEGISRTHSKLEDADLIIFLADASENEDKIKKNIKYFYQNFDLQKSLLVFSKSDIKNKNFEKIIKECDGYISISIYDDYLLRHLKKKLSDKVIGERVKRSSSDIMLTNLRHKVCLENVVKSLKDSLASLTNNMSGEYISVDLRNALNHLGEITGEITNEDILNNIFSKFCIGK